MKKTLLLKILLLCCVYTVSAQQETVDWYYPVLPGSTEWAAFTTHSQMLEVCQIPKDILKQLDTKQLLSLCLDYPLKVDFYVYNSLLEGVNSVAARFNGLQELLSRRDNAVCLISQLQTMRVSKFSDSYAKSLIGEAVVKQSILEILLSLDPVIEKMDSQQRNVLADLSMENLDAKIVTKEHFSQYSVEASALLLAKALRLVKGSSEKEQSASYHILIDRGSITDMKVIEELKKDYNLNKQKP